jgi:hypothetical protein
VSGRDDRLSPATYTVGEVRDLAEKIFVAYIRGGKVGGDLADLAAETAIKRAQTFARVWGVHVQVKP